MGSDHAETALRTRARHGARRAREALERDAEDLASFSQEGHELAKAAAEAVAKLAAALQRQSSNTSVGSDNRHD